MRRKVQHLGSCRLLRKGEPGLNWRFDRIDGAGGVIGHLHPVKEQTMSKWTNGIIRLDEASDMSHGFTVTAYQRSPYPTIQDIDGTDLTDGISYPGKNQALKAAVRFAEANDIPIDRKDPCGTMGRRDGAL